MTDVDKHLQIHAQHYTHAFGATEQRLCRAFEKGETIDGGLAQIKAECDHVCVVVDRTTGNVVGVDVPGLSEHACNCIATAVNRALAEVTK